MSETPPTRQQALELLKEFNRTDRALKHALAVEAVMRHMAIKAGGDVQKWGIVGLIHDLDFEMFPEQHCTKTRQILAERGWPEEVIRAAVAHGWGTCSNTDPQSLLEKTLYAIDELTGLVSAVALVRPSRSLEDLEARSVRKKWKDLRFAAGVDRGVIEKGAEMLGVELSQLITDVIEGMKPVASELGFASQAGPLPGTEPG